LDRLNPRYFAVGPALRSGLLQSSSVAGAILLSSAKLAAILETTLPQKVAKQRYGLTGKKDGHVFISTIEHK